jgi:UDP-2,4-diacetamido-2,4,6-trideoxy-beta-L-altropyranose hydrolase
VVRCLTLAEGLRALGAHVQFLSCELPGNILALVRRSGFDVLALSVASSDNEAGSPWLLGMSWQDDAAECVTLAEAVDGRVDWLIVDHYGLDWRWEAQMRPHVEHIAVIDDLANRSHDCDLLIDSNLQAHSSSRYDGLVPQSCLRLQGPKFAPLRPEFAEQRAALRQRDGKVRRILVCFGGTDPSNQTTKALQAITSLKCEGIATDVVVGASNPHKEMVRAFCSTHPGIAFHCQTTRMAELMAAADLAIGAGGTSIWERCAVALPSIVVTVAENQVPSTRIMAEHGCLLSLGNQDEVSAEAIAHVILGLVETPCWLSVMSARSAELVDGRGAERVVGFFAAPGLHLREALWEDCGAIHSWRSDEQTRSFSHDSRPIPYEIHERWFRDALANPIGTEWMRCHYPAVREIRAEVLYQNKASHAVFADAGYVPYCSIYKQDC